MTDIESQAGEKSDPMNLWTLARRLCPHRTRAYLRWFSISTSTISDAARRAALMEATCCWTRPEWKVVEDEQRAMERRAERLRARAYKLICFILPGYVRAALISGKYKITGIGPSGQRVVVSREDMAGLDVDLGHNKLIGGGAMAFDLIAVTVAPVSDAKSSDDQQILQTNEYPVLDQQTEAVPLPPLPEPFPASTQLSIGERLPARISKRKVHRKAVRSHLKIDHRQKPFALDVDCKTANAKSLDTPQTPQTAHPDRVPTKKVADELYVTRMATFEVGKKRLPTAREDELWRKQEGLTRNRMRGLRDLHRPADFNVRKGGAPRKNVADNLAD